MYQRVLYETWHQWVPYVAFGVTAFVFTIMCTRGMTLNKESAKQMSQLPLDD